MDFIVKENAKIIGKVISKELPKDALVGMVLRADKPIVPENGFKVEKGDRVFVVSVPSVVSKVKKLFVP